MPHQTRQTISPEHRPTGRRRLLGIAVLALSTPAVLMTAALAARQVAPAAFLDNLAGHEKGLWRKSHNWANDWAKNNTGWRKENVRFSEGVLHLDLTRRPVAGRPFAGGEYQTRAFYHYGRYEARIKSVAREGLVTSFFTYTGPTFDGDPHHEIDFEFLGRAPHQVQLNYYTDGVGKHETHIDLGFDASKEFHTYAFEWRPDSIRWFVDGRLVHEERGDRGPLPSRPGKIYLNLWAGQGLTGWLGDFVFPGHPLTAEVACVSFRSLDSNEPGCGD